MESLELPNRSKRGKSSRQKKIETSRKVSLITLEKDDGQTVERFYLYRHRFQVTLILPAGFSVYVERPHELRSTSR